MENKTTFVTMLSDVLDMDMCLEEQIIYSIIYSFTQAGQKFIGSYEYLKKWTRCKSDSTISKHLKNLLGKGYIKRELHQKNGAKIRYSYSATPISKVGATPKNEVGATPNIGDNNIDIYNKDIYNKDYINHINTNRKPIRREDLVKQVILDCKLYEGFDDSFTSFDEKIYSHTISNLSTDSSALQAVKYTIVSTYNHYQNQWENNSSDFFSIIKNDYKDYYIYE